MMLNAGQKYCRMLQREHSAIHLAFIKPPVVIKDIKPFVLSISEWPFYTGTTVGGRGLYLILFPGCVVNIKYGMPSCQVGKFTNCSTHRS